MNFSLFTFLHIDLVYIFLMMSNQKLYNILVKCYHPRGAEKRQKWANFL